MRPTDYADCYLNLYHYTRDDTAVRGGIRNYLQSGKGQQSVNAQALKAKFYRAIAKERGFRGNPPARFDIFQYDYTINTFERVFMGKGAPDEIQDTLWVMDRLGVVDGGSVNGLCDLNLGIDCGGFVANYWGFGRPTPDSPVPSGWSGWTPRMFWEANPSGRRKHLDQVRIGDAVIFFTSVKDDNPNLKAKDLGGGKFDTSVGSKAEHIGLTDGYEPMADPKRILLWVTDSSGAKRASGWNGVTTRTIDVEVGIDRQGWVYGKTDTGGRLYFLAPKTTIMSYLPWGVTDE